MIFFTLILSISCYFETLTLQNYTMLINDSQNYPVFALLQSRWCPHCAELKPTWSKVKSHFENDTRFYFADISCDSDNKLCHLFNGTGTPRIFWVKQGIEKAEQYINSYTYDAFIQFVEKRLAPPVADITSHEEYEAFLKENEEMSIIAYQEIPELMENTTQSKEVFFKLAFEYDTFPCRFINMKYIEFDPMIDPPQPVLKYINLWTNTSDRLKRASSQEKFIRQFVSLYSYPPITQATNYFLKDRVRSRNHFMLYYDNDKVTFYGKLVRLTKKFPPWFKTGVIDCQDSPRSCRLFGMKLSGGHELTIVLPHKNIYYRFEGTFDNESVYNWVNRVLDGKEEAMGPGAGLKGFFFNWKLEMKKPGYWSRTIKRLIIAIVLIYLVVKGLLKCIELGTPPENEEEDKNEPNKENQNEGEQKEKVD